MNKDDLIEELHLRVEELEERCEELGYDKQSWYRICEIHCQRLTLYKEAMQSAMDLLDQEDPQYCAAYAVLRNATRNTSDDIRL